MKVFPTVLLILGSLFSVTCYSQYTFSGQIDKNTWTQGVYLSVIEDYRKVSGVYPEQIIAKTTPDSTGYFSFSGNNLSSENKMYRIHVDSCEESEQSGQHFNGECNNSREIIFVANNNDRLEFPFSFDSEMFCKVISDNEKGNAFLKIDSLKNDMRFAFGTYRSEANRKINTEKWFQIFQVYGKELNEPLAELYAYAFLSDRSKNLYAYYLEDLQTNPYYNNLLERLKKVYPNSTYTLQFEAEITADRYLVSKKMPTSTPWWFYLVVFILLLSLLVNLFLFKKLHKISAQHLSKHVPLSSQEQKVLELILRDKTNKEIATQLFLSLSTVKTHINNLYKKLNVSSRDEVKSLFPDS